jgi:hypothetical protein
MSVPDEGYFQKWVVHTKFGERTVQLLDDFKISGVNGTRILSKLVV